MEDYEEMLIQITDILKAHNRYHMSAPDHKQAIEQIKNVVFPDEREKGKWIFHNDYNESIRYGCNRCGNLTNVNSRFCPNCGKQMER